MSMLEIKVPDIGDFKDIPVIEVLVKPGDVVKAEDSLVTLESDKATMDVPSPAAGTVRELKVKPGDKVSEGSVIVLLEAVAVVAARADTPAAAGAAASAVPGVAAASAPAATAAAAAPATAAASRTVEVKVPDIGDFSDIPIIEILVKAGDTVAADASLVTLESDKATMDVPAPVAGNVRELKVKVGDKVSEGTLILSLDTVAATTPAAVAPAVAAAQPPAETAAPKPAAAAAAAAPAPSATAINAAGYNLAHASPAIRKFARELGVDLARVSGSGPKGRIQHEDVQGFVKQALTGAAGAPPAASTATAGGGLNLLAWPSVDFAKFGPVETRPLSRIQKISGANLHRNWVMIPHVTNHDDADITDLEAFRVQLNKEMEKSGVKVTMLAFLIKAAVAALQKFPQFNASLDGETLVLKKYFHIGFAADTPNGLMVPVIRNADQKGIVQIAKEMTELSAKAREGKLGAAEMQGGCFSISSLGGIGGTYFTPIINAPEVSILGVCRSATRPVWDGKQFAPRLILPLSLSWDHRVIDGAAAARFNSFLAALLADMRRIML